MFVAQFGSKSAWGFRPAWLGGIGNQHVEESPEAKTAWGDMPYADFQPDGYGDMRAPAAISKIDVSGIAYCGPKRTQAEWERELRRHLGRKDWLIGYRSLSCRCDPCEPPLRCCAPGGADDQVAWFAKRARFVGSTWADDADTGARWARNPNAVSLRFEADTHWLKMTRAHWLWGVPDPYDYLNTGDRCRAPEITEMAWPCDVGTLLHEPPFRWFYRDPGGWQDVYCIGNWSAGKWIQAHIGTEDDPGEATIHVVGDTAPLSRLAFTNFSWLTVEICSPSGQSCRVTLDDTWIGEPQYVYVDSRMGAETRYCPIHVDDCIHVEPDAEFVEVATVGAPYPIGHQSCPLVGQLYPGRNVLRFWGFRLPGHRFHFSYDTAENFI